MDVGSGYIDQIFVVFDIHVMVIFHVGVEIGAPRIDDDFAQQAGIGELVQGVINRCQRYPHAILQGLAMQHLGAHMAVFGAVISYVLQMLSFILLRRRLPEIERPYRSPVL